MARNGRLLITVLSLLILIILTCIIFLTYNNTYFFPHLATQTLSELELEIADLRVTATAHYQSINSTQTAVMATAFVVTKEFFLEETRQSLLTSIALDPPTLSPHPFSSDTPSSVSVSNIPSSTPFPEEARAESSFINTLRDSIWDGIGGIVATLALILAVLEYRRKQRS